MSRHRASAPLLAEPVPFPAPPPAGVLGSILGSTDQERWYGLVLAFPDTAVRILNDQRVSDPVELAALRAQATLRLDQGRTAMMYARTAIELALNEIPVRPARLLPLTTIFTDAAVVAGTPDAIGSCADFVTLCQRFRDEDRRLVALGLEAVAVYHQRGCQEATRLLDDLRRACIDRPEAAAAVALANEGLNASCARRREPHWPPVARPMITACGWVPCPLTEQFLADRLMRWPGVHNCTSTLQTGQPA